jgi:hypothetical protein
MDLHGITAYGPKVGSHEGVLIVYATVNKEFLLKKAEKASDHAVVDYKDFKIHTWVHHRGKHEHKAAGAFFKDDVMVFSSTADNVKKALDVLKGDAKSLDAKKDSPLAQATPAGTMFVARAMDISQAEAICKSPLVKKSKQFSLVKGENEGKVFTDASLVADSKETAEEMKQVVDGLRAMALLHAGSDEGIKKLIDQVKVSVQDSTVSVHFDAAADAVIAQSDKVCQHWAKMKEKHAKMLKERKEKKEHKEQKLEKKDL